MTVEGMLDEGETLAEIPVLAGEDVPRITYGQMLVKLLKTAFLSR